jgi:actin-related protein
MGNVVLTGGGSLFAGFGERLSNELSRNFPHVGLPVYQICSILTNGSNLGENTCTREHDRTPVRRVVGREYPCQLGHFPPTLDK